MSKNTEVYARNIIVTSEDFVVNDASPVRRTDRMSIDWKGENGLS